MYYYEAQNLLGVRDPKYVYPVDVDPLVTPVEPAGLVPGTQTNFGGAPQVYFPLGTPPGSVLPGKETPK